MLLCIYQSKIRHSPAAARPPLRYPSSSSCWSFGRMSAPKALYLCLRSGQCSNKALTFDLELLLVIPFPGSDELLEFSIVCCCPLLSYGGLLWWHGDLWDELCASRGFHLIRVRLDGFAVFFQSCGSDSILRKFFWGGLCKCSQRYLHS